MARGAVAPVLLALDSDGNLTVARAILIPTAVVLLLDRARYPTVRTH